MATCALINHRFYWTCTGSRAQKQTRAPEPNGPGLSLCPEVTVGLPNLDARLTGAQAAAAAGVSRQLIYSWWTAGDLTRGPDGRYRYGDVLAVERAKRRSGYSHRRLVAA